MREKGPRWSDAGGRTHRACRNCGGPHLWQACTKASPAAVVPDAAFEGSRKGGFCYKCRAWGHHGGNCPKRSQLQLPTTWLDKRRRTESGDDPEAGVAPVAVPGAPECELSRRRRPSAAEGAPERDLPRERRPAAAQSAPECELSREQRGVLDRIVDGQSVFFTGCAGTGKSFLLRQAIKVLREQHGDDGGVAVCASTGMAAVNIGGVTVHSWAGIGLGEGTPEALLQGVQRSRQKSSNWKHVQTLVIDEISMLEGRIFDVLEFIARNVRKDNRPFGGVQLVLCGDFFQLPPVGLEKQRACFCFDAASWQQVVPQDRCFVLTTVFRQRDAEFVRLLGEVRRGGAAMSAATCALLQAAASCQFRPGLEPTRLYPHNATADEINESRLAGLPGEQRSYQAVDAGQQPYLGQLQKHCQGPETLVLKPGAQIMLLRNLNVLRGHVNGARGVVVEFKPGKGGELMPVVRLQTEGSHGEDLVHLGRESWDVELNGKVVAQRRQVPLRLAWAISIHKSQGMTIDALETDLRSVFDYGQAYVALSRATCLERLRVLGFNPALVRTHPRVVEFWQSLEAAGAVAAPPAGPGLPLASPSTYTADRG